MIVGGTYNTRSGTVEDLQLALTIEEEILTGHEGGQVITVNRIQYILWGRKVDKKNRIVTYQLMEKGA